MRKETRTLEKIREKIDSIDDAIIHLLAQRSELVRAAGKLKKDEHGVRDQKRVEQVIERARTKAAEAGLAPDIAEKIYRTIVTCFVDAELKGFKHEKTIT